MHKKMGLGAGAAATAVVLAMGAVASAAPWKLQSTGKLADLSTAVSAMDGAQAHLTGEEVAGGTRVRLRVTGFDHGSEGQTFGAHVHTGPCVAGDGAAAGPHYNAGGGISPTTEVWLDLTVERGGVAESVAVVPFTIPDGTARSVVIHALPTNSTNGLAGARLACLPAEF